MPHQLKRGMTSLLHGLDESIHLFSQTIQELVEGGCITQEEAQQRIRTYQQKLAKSCSMVDATPGELGIDSKQRQALKEEFNRIAWRLQLIEEEGTEQKETDAIVAYLNHKRQQALQQLDGAIKIALSLFRANGNLRIARDTYIQLEAVNQLNQEAQRLRLPCWYWDHTPIHFDQKLVDEIERQTQCQATIFQRFEDGFIRISTNIRTLNGRRGVGTFIPHNSKVAQTIMNGKTFRGSAFVLNNWYISIYEPIIVNGQVEGILYVGRKEALELMPMNHLSTNQVDKIFGKLLQTGAFDAGIEDDLTEGLLTVLSNLPENATHPVINIGLKEVAAILAKEREKKIYHQNDENSQPPIDQVTQYIKQNLSEDISIDSLAELSCMSKASFYRYFKTKYNTTPNVYINQERVRQAFLIFQENPSLSVREVCQEIGFKSTSYFIKLFRQQYGLTPKQFQLEQERRTLKAGMLMGNPH